MRAIRARYNPYLQAKHRLEQVCLIWYIDFDVLGKYVVCSVLCVSLLTYDQLKQLGHSVDKVEYIVMGGTFMALDEEYRDYFIRNLHDALSGHTSDSVEEAVK